MKPNSQLREKLMLLDSLCPDTAYNKAILEQDKAIHTLEFKKNSKEVMKYLKKHTFN